MTTFNLSVGGDFTPFLKYDARSGRFRVRMEGGEEVDISEPRLAFDFDSVKTGWICFPQGAAPQYVWDTPARQIKPGPINGVEYKEGFSIAVYGGDPIRELSGQKLGLREWSSTSNATKSGFLNAHGQYQAGQAANPGGVPVFRMTGVKTIKTKNGTNYEPIFVLDKWVARSAIPAFGGNGSPAPTPVPAGMMPGSSATNGAAAQPLLHPAPTLAASQASVPAASEF